MIVLCTADLIRTRVSDTENWFFSQRVSGQDEPNPAMWLVPGAGGFSDLDRGQRNVNNKKFVMGF